ncbi:MAG: hypothetical protein WCI49_03220 [Ferruginibacter sp.]
MKKIITAIAVTLICIQSASACEICGCGTGNYYLGLVPGFHHHFFGLRYQFRNFKTVMSDDPSQFSKDYYQSVELWGGINLSKKIQLIGIVPVNYIHQVSDDGIVNKSGLGDIAILMNYKLFDKTATKGKSSINQQLWIGAGLKLPTGKFNIDVADPMIVTLANTQTGTASTDFMLNAMYNVTIKKFGINTNLSYKINSANKDKYSFGNKLSTGLLASYTLPKKGVNVIPNAGVSYEHTAGNNLQSQKVALTGGYLSLATAGVELGFKKFTIGANVQLPLAQNYADGQTEAKTKGMAHFTFSF